MTKIRIAVQSWCGESKLRKVSQSFGCLLLLGALLDGSSCNHDKNLSGGSRVTLTNMPVKITNCVPTDDLITTDTTHDVVWKSADNHDYTITFDQKTDLNNSPQNDITPFPNSNPPHSLPVPANGTATWPTSNTPTNCSIVTTSTGGTKQAGCYYKYSIAFTGGSVCNDPGVHVIPTGGLSDR
jgi:hypothetical protein